MHEHARPHARPVGFSAERSARLLELERFHFWFVARSRLLRRLLAQHLTTTGPVLDVGCGGAALSAGLAAHGHRVVALDRSTLALRAVRSQAPRLLSLRGDATQLPIRAGSMHAALALDVLEHVDDRALLGALHAALAPRGLLLLTVPALQWLWSYRDDAAGHLRRYTREQLHGLLADTGYDVLESHYYQCLLFPLLAATRLAGRSGPGLRDLEERPHHVANWALSAVNRLEVDLGRVVPWPIGSSLAVVCRKVA